MGSFACSLHVKCDDAARVVAAVEEAMRDAGYGPTEAEPEAHAMLETTPSLRAVHVSEARDGWVGVLDSDLMNANSLAAALSRHLATWSLLVMVNDSDSWYYQLYHRGADIDEFNSMGELEGMEDMWELPPDVDEEQMMSSMAAFQQEMEQALRNAKEQKPEEPPGPIREILQRMQNGTATEEELKQYGEWCANSARGTMDAVNAVFDGLKQSMGAFSAPKTDFGDHWTKLHPILPPVATESLVSEVLGKQAVFAEEVLGEFLALLGIQPLFANLSYDYLKDFAGPMLTEGGVRMVAHLKFRTTPESC